MKRLVLALLTALLTSLSITGCIVSPGPSGYEVEDVPPLPAVVELGNEPYVHQRGYHYYYHDDRWHYSREDKGPWKELPKDRWPRETRVKGGAPGGPMERGQEREHEQGQGHEHERR